MGSRRPSTPAMSPASTAQATMDYLRWTVFCGAVPAILNVVMAYLVRSEGATLHASIGTMSGCLLNIVLDPIFILPQGLGMGAAGARPGRAAGLGKVLRGPGPGAIDTKMKKMV